MKEIQVLLSSYNGEKYIKEQIDSILAQKNAEVQLLIRDDGSSDGTRQILKEYADKYANVSVVYGENVGVIRSFFELIESADVSVPYVALADQDDVWLPDKLYRAITLLEMEKERMPLVYCSARQLVDAELHPIPAAMTYPDIRPEFGNALVENMCTGCTSVINQQMLLLLKGRTPEFTVMHDFWVYLVGTCLGKVVYDEESFILYRQHGNNVVGSASSIVENYKRRIKNFKKNRGQLTRQATELLRIYGEEMPEENRQLAEKMVLSKTDKKVRKQLLKERKVFRQRKSDNWIFRQLLRYGQL